MSDDRTKESRTFSLRCNECGSEWELGVKGELVCEHCDRVFKIVTRPFECASDERSPKI
jgi:DNA-directed RNA polymerase subunit RPC12/RpoP